MPTASTTSTTRTKARAKRRNPTRRNAAATGARTTPRPLTGVAPAGSRRRPSDRPAAALGDYAERAVMIPVGATLIARDRVVSSVSDTFSIYSSPTRTQAQLRKFERRGATARKRLEREVRKTRVRVERELRQRRKNVERTLNGTVSDLEKRRDAITKNGSE